MRPALGAAALLGGCLLLSGSGKPLHAPPEECYRRALALVRRGAFDEGLRAASREAAYWQSCARTEWYWQFRLLNAEILLSQSRYPEALKLLNHNSAEIKGCLRVEIRSRLVEAQYGLRLSRLNDAGAQLAQAMTLAETGGFEDLRAEAAVLRGQLLARQNRLDEAERTFQAALGTAREQYTYASAANGLGMVAMMRSRCDEALPRFQQAFRIWRGLGADYAVVGAANNLGMCYSHLGDYDLALEYRQQAMRLVPPSARLAEVAGETGNLYMMQERPHDAIPYYRRALDASKRFDVPAQAARWSSNLAAALVETQDWDAAEQMNREALLYRSDVRSRPFIELNEAAIAAGRNDRESAARTYQRAIASAPDNPSVLWQAYTGLANLSSAAGDHAGANRYFEAAIAVVEHARADLSGNEHKITFLARLIRFYQDYVDSLIAQNNPLKALEVTDSSRARVLAERLSMRGPEKTRRSGAEDPRAVARRSRSVWLVYWVAPRRSFLWAITPRQVENFVLPPGAEIQDAVKRYRGFTEASLRDPMRSESDAGRWLFEKLVAPAAHLIPPGSSVTIVPDGPLYQLNFETLPVYAGKRRYWIDDVTATVAPSLAVSFDEMPGKSASDGPLLVIGDPVPASPDFPKLAYAPTEIAGIAQRFAPSRATVITGASARPESYAACQPGRYSFIHIAAHAEANRLSPLDSAVVLSPGGHGYKLYARDILGIPLRADLVTISACRSSGARAYAGEGLVGFAWAFMQAGAHAVVAGLWDVPDQSTAAIMDRMYAGIVAGSTPAEALREAKLPLVHGAQSKPFYWGPFQVYACDPDPGVRTRRGNVAFAAR